MNRITYTAQELLAQVWPDENRLGTVVAQKAIDFDNLTLSCRRDVDNITLSKDIVGLTKNESSYKIIFTKNLDDRFYLSSLTLMGHVQDPITIERSELDSILDDFKFDFRQSPSKTQNFTQRVKSSI